MSVEWRIYEFVGGNPTYTDVVVLLENSDDGPWADCTGIAFPQFKATCYGSPGGRWGPTGTRLYVLANDGVWKAFLRIDIVNRDGAGQRLPLSDWTFALPKLVFAGLLSSAAEFYEPDARGGIRPKATPEENETTVFSYLRRSGQQTYRVDGVLDTDLCLQKYAHLAAGDTLGSNSLWLECLDPSFYTDHVERPEAWQSPEALIDRASRSSKSGMALYRRYVKGPLAGTSVLLVEGGFGADAGF